MWPEMKTTRNNSEVIESSVNISGSDSSSTLAISYRSTRDMCGIFFFNSFLLISVFIFSQFYFCLSLPVIIFQEIIETIMSLTSQLKKML